MTTELTHEQAAALRAIAGPMAILGTDLWLTLTTGVDDLQWLSDVGKEALAAYDVKWCVIERAQLEHVVKRGRAALSALDDWADDPDGAVPILAELLGALDALESKIK